MSGSPLYVRDQGTDELVGAVSYGDIFTKGNLGLATPVEYMADMETTFLPGTVTLALARAVHADGHTLTRITVAGSARAARALPRRADTAVMAPLTTVAIAGLPPQSAAYKRLAALMEARGCDVAPSGSLLGGQDQGFQTPLVGGASVAVLLSRGDVLSGAFGTVTWNDGQRVVAFGHPLMGMGDVQFYLTNAYVHGVWSSTISPYKLVSPGDVRGTLLQDRGSGVAGVVGDLPAEVPFTSSVTLRPQGSVGRATSYMPEWVVTGYPGGDGAYMASSLVAAAGYKASDNASMPGGATTTTTVVVSDGVNPPTTIVRTNTWDDTYDVLGLLSTDAATMLSTLITDQDGVAPATIVSVDMSATASPVHTSARIVGARFPDGLHAGKRNRVQVVLNLYGQPTPYVVDGTIDLPASSSTSGSVNVYPAAVGPGSDGSGVVPQSAGGATSAAAAGADPATLADRIAAVKALPTNDQLVVAFTPDGGSSTAAGKGDVPTPAPTPVSDGSGSVDTTLTVTGRYVTGALQRHTGQVGVHVTPSTVPYEGSFRVHGTLAQAAGESDVEIFAQPWDATERTLIATVKAEPDGQGGATFACRAKGFPTTTRITAVWAGDTQALGASDSTRVRVAQKATLKAETRTPPAGAATRLTATVLPGKPGQTVLFQRRDGGRWVLLKSVRARAAAEGVVATMSWTAPAGVTAVRVRVPATAANAASASAPLTIRPAAR